MHYYINRYVHNLYVLWWYTYVCVCICFPINALSSPNFFFHFKLYPSLKTPFDSINETLIMWKTNSNWPLFKMLYVFKRALLCRLNVFDNGLCVVKFHLKKKMALDKKEGYWIDIKREVISILLFFIGKIMPMKYNEMKKHIQC